MKVRALTIGVSVPNLSGLEPAFRDAVAAGNALRQGVEAAGWEVQTVRVASNPFEDWLGPPASWASPTELQACAATVAAACEATQLEFVNVGPARTVEGIRAIPTLLKASPCISASAGFEYGEEEARAAEKMDAVVATMLDLARDPETKGLANFRFCAAFGCEPATPFFPAAFHATGTPMAVSVGLENGDAVVEAFEGASTLAEATARLQARFRKDLEPLQALIEGLVAKPQDGAPRVAFAGIDTSVNPTLDDATHSLVRAYEHIIGEGHFGKSGTLAVSEALTRAVTTLGPSIRLTGYCGLMLPAMEDHLLAARAAESPPAYGIPELMMNSAVCGVGIDTVPVSLPELEAHPGRAKMLLRDLAALARKKRRPLSCRLFPVPGGHPGELTDFSSPYLCNTRIFPLQ